MGSGGLASSKGVSVTGGVIQTSGAILSSASATSTFSSGGVSVAGGGLASSKGIDITGGVSRLGTIIAGTWQGTAVGAVYGGTAQTAVATGDVLYGSATNAWSRLGAGTRGTILSLTTGGIPGWIATSTFAHLNVANAFTNTGTSTFSGNIQVNERFDVYTHLRVGDTATTSIFGSATSTFGGGINILAGGIDINVPSCTQALETDASGAIICGTDETGGGGGSPNLIYRTLSTTKYFTASTSATDNLAFHFNNGFVSSASSTIAGQLNLLDRVDYQLAATSTIVNLTSAFTFATSTTNTSLLTLSTKPSRYGRIGIGTSTPQAIFALDVPDVISGNTRDNIFLVSSSSFPNLIIDEKGYVGIGTSSPGRVFSVGRTQGIGTSTFAGGVDADSLTIKQIASCSGANALTTDARGGVVCGAVGGDTIVEKDADESFTSSTTMAHDTDLKFTMTANTAYRIRINAWYKASNAADLKYGVSVGGAPEVSILKFLGQAIVGSTTNEFCVVTKGSVCSIISATVHDSILELVGIASPGTADRVFHFDRAQNGSDTVATTIKKNSFIAYAALSGTADLAEIYMSADSSLIPGEVVTIDPSLSQGIKRSSLPYERSLIGVVSTNPALLIGADSSSEGYPTPVALAGRVPVNVTSENGPIEPGDFLTSSSIPGVAMKAAKAGAVFGQALAAYDGPKDTVGTVTAFVENTYINGSMSAMLSEGGTPASPDEGRNLLGKFVAYQQSGQARTNLSEMLTDRIGAGLEIISPRVVTDTLVTNVIEPVEKDMRIKLIESGVFTIERVSGEMLSMSFGGSATSSLATVVHIDALGSALFNGALTAVGGFTVGSPDHPSGITLYDRETKEPYCLQMRQGAFVSLPGVCGEESIPHIDASPEAISPPVVSEGVPVEHAETITVEEALPVEETTAPTESVESSSSSEEETISSQKEQPPPGEQSPPEQLLNEGNQGE